MIYYSVIHVTIYPAAVVCVMLVTVSVSPLQKFHSCSLSVFVYYFSLSLNKLSLFFFHYISNIWALVSYI
jgi:hypothetical protein